MVYNGIDYNEKWVLSLTLEEFMGHIANTGKDEALLIEVYNIIHALSHNQRTVGNYANNLKHA